MADAELTVARRRAADLEKREQRLMTAFKKQIYVFRESVRLLFGYKVDMSVDESAESGANACVATLRSQFTLHADDEDERHEEHTGYFQSQPNTLRVDFFALLLFLRS